MNLESYLCSFDYPTVTRREVDGEGILISNEIIRWRIEHDSIQWHSSALESFPVGCKITFRTYRADYDEDVVFAWIDTECGGHTGNVPIDHIKVLKQPYTEYTREWDE